MAIQRSTIAARDGTIFIKTEAVGLMRARWGFMEGGINNPSVHAVLDWLAHSPVSPSPYGVRTLLPPPGVGQRHHQFTIRPASPLLRAGERHHQPRQGRRAQVEPGKGEPKHHCAHAQGEQLLCDGCNPAACLYLSVPLKCNGMEMRTLALYFFRPSTPTTSCPLSSVPWRRCSTPLSCTLSGGSRC